MNRSVGARLLRMALLGNAGFSVFSATIIFVRQRGLMQRLGIPKDFGILFLGIGLMIFAVWLLINASRAQIKVLEARMAVAMDLAWVALTIPVVVSAPLTSQGQWVVTIVAAVVLSFTVTQWIGIRRISGDSTERMEEVRRA
jgi:hypothetical protein